MFLSFLFFPSFCISFKQDIFKLYSISPFLSSQSNLSVEENKRSINSFQNQIYSSHPIFLGLPHQSPVNLAVNSLRLKRITFPLLHGFFSSVILNSVNIENIILTDKSNDRCGSFANIESSECFLPFFDCNSTILNCRIENFFPPDSNGSPQSKCSSVIQSYGSNVTISHSSFLYCNSLTSPVLFSALSSINFLYSNFSFNSATSEGVFSMTSSDGRSERCFFGNNEANENSVCSLSMSSFDFHSNAIVHNRAEINSIVYIVNSNSLLRKNYFVANRIQPNFYGVVTIEEDQKTPINVSFVNCVFSLNKEIEDMVDENGKNSFGAQNNVFEIIFRCDADLVIDKCNFDKRFEQAIIAFKGNVVNYGSSFGTKVKTPYDIFDNISFLSVKGFKMNFDIPKQTFYAVFVLMVILCAIAIVLALLYTISRSNFIL